MPTDFEPFPKNPHIAQIFTQIGRSEELGTGIRKVYKYAKAYAGSANVSFIEQDVFVTKVPLDKVFFETTMEDGGTNGGTSGGTSGGIKELLEFIEKSPGKRTNEIAETIAVPPKTVEKWIAVLKKEGKIKFVGSKKTGGYYIQ